MTDTTARYSLQPQPAATMLALVLMLFAAPTAFAAPVPKELRKTERNTIVGVWIVTGSCNGGGQINPPDGSSWKFDADGQATIIRKAGDTAGGIKFAIDPKTEPKSFDWVCPWGEWYGVYELKDDTFTIYLSSKKQAPDKGRNMQLNTGPGIEMYSFTRSGAAK